MTSTTATPSTTFQGTGISNRRRWLVVSVGALALAGATVAVVAFDGSDTDRPAVESVVPASPAVEGPVSADAAERHALSATAAATAVEGPVSADAAERHAITSASKCTVLPADAAERCATAAG